MAQIFTFKYKDVEDKDISGNSINVLSDSEANRVFLSSRNINVFPCSRRGREELEDSIKQYDPEARLNTERTNRLHTAVNGFTKSFIDSFNTYDITVKDENGEERETETNTLIFVLAGYYVEAKNFNPTAIASALGSSTGGTIYAHLSLYDKASLSAEGYFTEILYRQFATTTDSQYLDITYSDTNTTNDFFVGISFTKEAELDKTLNIPSYNLPLFTYSGSNWELVQTSLLPKVEHGETEDSIKLGGNLEVTGEDTTLKKLSAGATDVGSLVVEGTTYLKGTAQIDGEATLYNKLLVKSGSTTRAEIDSSKVSFNLPVTVNDTLQVKRTTGTGPAARVEGSLEVHEGISTETINANTIQSVETLKTDNAKGLVVTSTAVSPEHTLKVEGKTHITDSVTAPTLDVKTIKNTATDASVNIEDSLSISGDLTVKSSYGVSTPTLKVNTIETRSTDANAEITISKPLKVTSNLKVEDNISVGTPVTTAPADNSGCIVAKNEIIAENRLRVPGTFRVEAAEKTAHIQNLAVVEKVNVGELSPDELASTLGSIVAKNNITAIGSMGTRNDLTVDRQAYVKTGLIVGNVGDTPNRLSDGEIKAKSKVTTPILVAENYINVGSPAIPTTTTGDIVAKNNIYAENMIVAKSTLKSPAMYQTVNSVDKPVPFIDVVEQDGGQYQLQISRVTTVNKVEN